MIAQKSDLNRFVVGTVLGLAVVAVATVLLSETLNIDGQSAFVLLPVAAVSVLALYMAIYVGGRSVIGDRLAGVITAVAYIFVASAIFRLRAYDDKSVDWQVAMKLAAFGAMSVTIFTFFSHAYRRIRFPPIFFVWLAFFAYLVVTSLYAPKILFSLSCSILFLVGYLFSVYMTVWLSRGRALQVMIWSGLILCVGSIFVFYAIPTMGRMQAWMPGIGITDVGRMKGILGSANGIGFVAAFAIVIAVIYFRTFDFVGRVAASLLIPSAAICLLLSNSRSSMIATVTAIWLSFVLRKGAGQKLFVSATAGLIGAVIFISFSDEIFALISRSGKTVEITNVTGRTDIWAVVIEMWLKSPIIGYGYSSTLSILPLDSRLFRTAAHAHNMTLELLFSGGIILAGLFVYAIGTTMLQLIRMRAVNEFVLLSFFLLRGLVEASPFSGMVGYSSLSFTVTLGLIIAKQIEARAQRRATPLRAQFSGPGAAPMLQQLRR